MRHIAIIILLAVSRVAMCQTDFIVYRVEGSPYLEVGGRKLPLRTGGKLTAKGTVVTGNSASVTLICRSYQPLQIGAGARVQLPKETARCAKPTEGFSTLYFRFFWDNITREKGNPEKDRRKYMDNLGGVIRGEEKCPAFNFRTDTINHFQGDFTIISLPPEEPAPNGMSVGVYEDFDSRTPLRVIEAPGDSVDLSRLLEGRPRGTSVHWMPSFNKGKSCTRHYLRLWKEDEFDALCERYLSGFTSSMTTEAERCHILGFFLERERFYADALRLYRMALEKEPGNIQYARSVEWFTKAYR